MMMFEDDDHEEDEEEDREDDDEEELNNSSPHPNYKLEIRKHIHQPQQQQQSVVARYRECLKNHAVNIGGHAVDGCGEFMPAGPDGSLDALKCAACNCHRNFHRKELLYDGNNSNSNSNNQLTIFTPRPHSYHPPVPPPHVFPFYPSGRGPTSFITPPPPQARPVVPPSSATEEGVIGGMATMTVTSTSSGKKRFRTKFTQEQKDKMLGFAERVGWKIQKQDEGLVQEFCNETGIKRHVLKVWMHNNKHTIANKP